MNDKNNKTPSGRSDTSEDISSDSASQKSSEQVQHSSTVRKIGDRLKSIKNIHISLSLTFLAFMSTNYYAYNTFKLSQAVADSTHVRFLRDNEPYLQISDLEHIDLRDGRHATFTFILKNLGNRPVQIISTSQKLMFVKKLDSLLFMRDPFSVLNPPLHESKYVSNQGDSLLFRGQELLPLGLGYAIENDLNEIYLVGRLDYTNYINKKKRRYQFVLRLDYIKDERRFITSYVLNDNFDL